MIPGTADEEAGAIVRFLGTLPQPGTGLKTAGSLGRFVGQPPPDSTSARYAFVPRDPTMVSRQKLQIPTLSSSVTRLLSLVTDDLEYFECVLEVLSGDPGLTCKALDQANSAAGGGQGNTETLQQALTRLGAKRFVTHVLGSHLVNVFVPSSPEMHRFWRHALTVATANRHLAKRFPRFDVDPDWGYVLGFLHNVGGMILGLNDPEGYTDLLRKHGINSDALRLGETRFFGTDHQKLGFRAVHEWGLPPAIGEIIAYHHDARPPRHLTAPKALILTRFGLEIAECILREDAEKERNTAKEAGFVKAALRLGLEGFDVKLLHTIIESVRDEALPEFERLGTVVYA